MNRGDVDAKEASKNIWWAEASFCGNSTRVMFRETFTTGTSEQPERGGKRHICSVEMPVAKTDTISVSRQVGNALLIRVCWERFGAKRRDTMPRHIAKSG